MKTYGVEIPIAGSVYVEINAENKKDAINKAFRSDVNQDDVSWETMEHVCQDNILFAPLNHVVVRELKNE